MKKTIKYSCSMIAIGFITIAFTFNAVIGVSEGQAPPCDAAAGDPVILHPPGPLSTVPIPAPDLSGVVRNPDLLIVLGKALFWDQQVGSDNQACASCHYHAGADNRSKNQLNPGIGDTSFTNPVGANYQLTPSDYPFYQLQDPADRHSNVVFDTNDITSSQGTKGFELTGITPREPEESCNPVTDEVYTYEGTRVRKVPPRNTPTIINAVFNHRNFWDGRANNIFNAVNPLGLRDAGMNTVCYTRSEGTYLEDFTDVNGGDACKHSSLASQAVGPALSDTEMTCMGKVFPQLGRKMYSLRPLALQEVHSTDSVLGPYLHRSGTGLGTTYSRLIRQVFEAKYWRARGKYRIENGVLISDSNGYTQTELNFAMFWGEAIQAYESTLVSDKTPYDVFIAANPTLMNDAIEGDELGAAGTNLGTSDGAVINYVSGFTEQELRGLDIFLNKGTCINCHDGPEFTGASVRLRSNELCAEPVERMAMHQGTALYDGGYYNIGVTPTVEDLLIGGETAGAPISYSRQLATGTIVDSINFNHNFFEVGSAVPVQDGERVAVDGACKTPTLRNCELTGPYFHNGGEATLRMVVEFYNRGGNRRDVECVDPNAVECLN